MTAGRDAATPGEGKNSWLTGTASWSFVSISQYILGVRPDYKGLVIDPCVPKSWKSFKVTRVFRGKTFNITVSNPKGVSKGVASITVDGKPVTGVTIPLDLGGGSVDVHVVMG